jgi:alkanesulfonate monooxygenase SsuD/methylene tetrahydromethanopterin reductase-like flavin-dependent oxidoreductase (luciferase family)
MSNSVQFGWVIPPGADFIDPPTEEATFIAELRCSLDHIRGSFDAAWMIDHLQFGSTSLLECWTTLTYFAALYPELHFGTVVMSQAFRNPALLAKMTASLQYLSGDQLYLGIGTGWHEGEYRAYGYADALPSPGTRVEQLNEAVQIIKSLWTEEQTSFTGHHYRIEDARCEPKPKVLPPIMIGGKKPRMLRLIARHADWWNVDWVGINQYRDLAAGMDAACAEVGRDPKTLRRTWFGWCTCAPTETEARSLAGDRKGFIGTPEQVIEQLQPFIELGVDYFIMACPDFPAVTTVELLAREVLPALQRT